MKKKDIYTLYNKYCLRLPTLSLDDLFELNDSIDSTDFSDVKQVVALLDSLFQNELFSEAIYTSSPALYNRYKYLKDSERSNLDKMTGLFTSFYKYFSRMAHRATPYGVFAGISTGDISQYSTELDFGNDRFRPVFQLNIQLITELLRKLDYSDPTIVGNMKFFVNNTLYIMKDRMYYVEKIDQNDLQASNLTSIGLNEHIQGILDRAENGASIAEMSRTITLEGATDDQKFGFVVSLIASQVLICDLWPTVSSDDFIKDFVDKLDGIDSKDERLHQVKAIHKVFRNVASIDSIKQIRKFIKESDTGSIVKRKNLFKADLFLSAKTNRINESVIKKIRDVSADLMILGRGETTSNLSTFVQKFHSKFEEREIPLVQAIDPNFGVGYALAVNGVSEYTPLIEGIPFGGTEENNNFPWNARMNLIRAKAKTKFYLNRDKIVHIDEDIESWIEDQKKRGAQIGYTTTNTYSFGSLFADSAEALDNGDFKFRVSQINAPYAGRLVSRFLHGDTDLKEEVQEICKIEQDVNPNAVLAEVVYVPDGKYANISLSAQLRDYEITYSSNSNLDRDHQININDLTVSVRNGRVVIRSKKLNKEIIPRMTNTYDARFGNPIYQFLSEVSYQNVNHGFDWDWGVENYEEPFLPRVEYKNFILLRSRWYLKQAKVNYSDMQELAKFCADLQEEWDLPRYVIIPEGDNELLIDFENPICRQILGKEISKSHLILHECLKTDGESLVKIDGKSFSNEIIIPFGTEKPMYQDYSNYSDVVTTSDEVQRVFSPGSEWLFVKIYSGTKILEDILSDVIGPFTKQLVNEGTIDKWFFLRYDDPDFHLRVRFHKSDKVDNHEWYRILERLQMAVNNYIPIQQSVKIMVDTYQREMERYGANNIDASETVFYADSAAITNFLDLISGDYGEQLRWKFSLVSVDRLLNDFGLNIEEKRDLLYNLSGNFFEEFGGNNSDYSKVLSKNMRDRYRAKTSEIASMLLPELFDPELAEGYECFEQRSRMVERDIHKITHTSRIERDNRIASFVHMTMNRLFIVNQRKHELLIYHYLHEFYKSEIAKQKNRKNEYAN